MNEAELIEKKIDLSQLTKNHLQNLKELFESATNVNTLNNRHLKEYFQFLSNSTDSKEIEKQEARKNASSSSSQPANKTFSLNWNLEYCESCKISYWPSNCTVYIVPKCRVTKKAASTYRKYKLFSYKPKYKSYKDKIIRNVIKKGITLIYECNRCKSKNTILKEFSRPDLKINMTKNKLIKDSKKLNIYNMSNQNMTANYQIKPTESKLAATKSKNLAIKRKFQSLQLKLKQNEENNKKKLNVGGGLFQFLENLN